jgi:homogentisate phytyltransferase/homogentisate geranylgeranyltransferase
MLNRILNAIENQKISILEWIVAFVGIIFVRFFLEVISSPTSLGFIPSDAQTLTQYGLSFLAIIFGIICIAGYFSKTGTVVAKLALYGLPIIWLGPIIDIITSLGKGHTITYIFDGPRTLLLDFLTFFGQQVTLGLRIELFFVICAVGFYVWYIRKNIKITICAILSSYLFLFFIFALPSLLFSVQHIYALVGQATTFDVVRFLSVSISQSNIFYNTIDASLSYGSAIRVFELGFDGLLAQICFILSLVFMSLWFWRIKREKFLAILKNSRPERVLFYSIFISAGAIFAFLSGLGGFRSWIDVMSFIILLISWYGGWMFAVHTNDMADVGIDSVSNPNRPIVIGKLSVEEMKQSAIIWLLVSLLGSFIVGPYTFFMNLVFLATYYIYSMPPLRLKRVPILSSFLISIACLSSVLAGFFFLSADKHFSIFPMMIALGIIVAFTLGVNVRDMKDIDGDKADGIGTLPVLFGRKGEKAIAIMGAIFFLILPIIFSFYTLYILTIPAAIVGYKIVVRKPYREKYVFILYFSFILATVLLVGGLYLFALRQNLLSSF